MKRPLSRFKPKRLIFMLAVICALLFCGLTAFTAFAAEEGSPDLEKPVPQLESATMQVTVSADGKISAEAASLEQPTPQEPEEPKAELFPADVQTIVEDGGRQIIKSYILTADDNPADIPREDFTRDGWRYTLTDITQKKTSGTDTRPHTEPVEINTDSNDLNAILAQLSPTLEYQSGDGYGGVLNLDMASVKCEAAGHKKNSYTVSATREYPHLSTNDLSLIPKTVTENGQTLQLDGVSWEAQNSVNVDYQDIPESYRAIAKYTTTATRSVVTGYVTTADYIGEIAKAYTGDTVYVANFLGTEINPTPKPEPEPPKPAPEPAEPEPIKEKSDIPVIPLIIGVAIIAALLAGGGVFLLLRHNVKVYAISDRGRVFVAKVRISANNPTIDLTPLAGRTDTDCFALEIDRFAAKKLNGRDIDIIYRAERLQHKIAYEGNTYRIEADFGAKTIKALY